MKASMLLPTELPAGVTDGDDLYFLLSGGPRRRRTHTPMISRTGKMAKTPMDIPKGVMVPVVGGAEGVMKGLGERLERKMITELKAVEEDDGEGTMRVYQEGFAEFIEGHPSYRRILSTIKAAYDDRVSYCSVLEDRVSDLESKLAYSSSIAMIEISKAEASCHAAIASAEDKAFEWQRRYEDATILANQHKETSLKLAEELKHLQARSEQDQKDKERLRSTLSYLSDSNNDLKKRIEQQIILAKQQQEASRSGRTEHEVSRLREEVAELEAKVHQLENKKRRGRS